MTPTGQEENIMNTNMMELNLNEMAMVVGGETGDVMDHVGGAITGVTVGAMAGAGVGCVAGAPGCVIGMCVGAVGCGVAGGVVGLDRVTSWVRSIFD